MDYIFVSFPGNVKYIKTLRFIIKDFLQNLGLKDEEKIYMFQLAINEAVANIIEHTYKFDSTKKLDIKLEYHKDSFNVTIRDYGRKVDVKNIKSRRLDDYKENGLGVFIINKVFGKIEWENINEGNLMLLKKKLHLRE